ncbi:MAG: arylamine N-acetyltransferase, partial [Propionivibrio sp.]
TIAPAASCWCGSARASWHHMMCMVAPQSCNFPVKNWSVDLGDDSWARVYELRRSLPEPGEYVRMNEVAATASHFASALILARTTPQERIVLAGNRLTRRNRTGILERTELDVEGLEDAIRTRFQLPFDPAWRPVLARAVVAA